MKKFIVEIPESVLEDVKAISDMEDEDDAYVVRRILETSGDLWSGEFDGITVTEVNA